VERKKKILKKEEIDYNWGKGEGAMKILKKQSSGGPYTEPGLWLDDKLKD